MSLSDLASIGSLISGVAVAITLIFLVMQMRQNTLAVKATATQSFSALYQQISNIVVVNGDMARIWRQGLDDIHQLSDDERVRFISYLSTIFRFMESARLQWRHGQLDNQHWYELETEIKDFSMQPGVKAYWALRRHWHADDFGRWFESLPPSEIVPAFYGKSAKTA